MSNAVIVEKFPLLGKRKDALERTISYLKANKTIIRDILTEVSPYQTAEDEINTSIKVLENAFNEMDKYKPPTLSSMSVFMPSNVLLYSYVLYLLIPSLYIHRIDFRGSNQVISQVRRIHQLLSSVHELPIHLLELPHREYIKESALKADLVAFTGTYKNAEDIKSQLHDEQMFVFFGQGVNPFIITEEANLNKAVDDLITVRTFNSGQDCMGPDVVYIPDTRKEEFLSLLESRLADMRYGENQNQSAEYGPIYYGSAVNLVSSHLNEFNKYIYFGGEIDYRTKVIRPTVLLSRIEDNVPIKEFFSPIFNIVTYDTLKELKTLFRTAYFRQRAMGATFYGDEESDLIEFLQKKHTVSVNETLLDIEDGNEPFGGYGPMANYISYKNKLFIQPVLLSKVLQDLWQVEQ